MLRAWPPQPQPSGPLLPSVEMKTHRDHVCVAHSVAAAAVTSIRRRRTRSIQKKFMPTRYTRSCCLGSMQTDNSTHLGTFFLFPAPCLCCCCQPRCFCFLHALLHGILIVTPLPCLSDLLGLQTRPVTVCAGTIVSKYAFTMSQTVPALLNRHWCKQGTTLTPGHTCAFVGARRQALPFTCTGGVWRVRHDHVI